MSSVSCVSAARRNRAWTCLIASMSSKTKSPILLPPMVADFVLDWNEEVAGWN
jgi:hypothetical protein